MTTTKVFGSGVLWFGAAVSIAEIEVGMQLGEGGLWAVVLGHVVGGILLFAAGLLGARLRKNSMGCVRGAFGRVGGMFFALANVLQLLGWTAVMVSQGADAAGAMLPGVPVEYLSMGIGVLVALWVYVGLGASRLSAVAVGLLFALTLWLSGSLWTMGGGLKAVSGSGNFWLALELSVAMPLSWLPLIGDYTSRAERPVAVSAVAAIVYSVVSTWMYGIGMLASRSAGLGTVAEVFSKTGLGLCGLFVVVFSTVTTTFLDAYSAGESATSLHAKIPAKAVGVGVALLGTALALGGMMERYTDFLYLIASVFAPMAAVLLWDAVERRKHLGTATRWEAAINGVAWVAGFALYHVLLRRNSPIGASLPSMAAAVGVRMILAAVWRYAYTPHSRG